MARPVLFIVGVLLAAAVALPATPAPEGATAAVSHKGKAKGEGAQKGLFAKAHAFFSVCRMQSARA